MRCLLQPRSVAVLLPLLLCPTGFARAYTFPNITPDAAASVTELKPGVWVRNNQEHTVILLKNRSAASVATVHYDVGLSADGTSAGILLFPDPNNPSATFDKFLNGGNTGYNWPTFRKSYTGDYGTVSQAVCAGQSFHDSTNWMNFTALPLAWARVDPGDGGYGLARANVYDPWVFFVPAVTDPNETNLVGFTVQFDSTAFGYDPTLASGSHSVEINGSMGRIKVALDAAFGVSADTVQIAPGWSIALNVPFPAASDTMPDLTPDTAANAEALLANGYNATNRTWSWGGSGMAFTFFKDVGPDSSTQTFFANVSVASQENAQPPSVSGVDGSAAPRSFVLSVAGVNPAGSALDFALALPRSGPISLRLYDCAGRLRSELLNGWSPAGWTRRAWSPPHGFPSGVYFLRADAGSEHRTQKFVLLR